MTVVTMVCSIDRDAQLLANRIALLKQEEMKTWKKIEETKKRTNDIQSLKKRNEEKVQKVSLNNDIAKYDVEILRGPDGKGTEKQHESEQLPHCEAATRRKKESSGRSDAPEEGGGQTSKDDQGPKRAAQTPEQLQVGLGEQNEKPDWTPVEAPCSDENSGR